MSLSCITIVSNKGGLIDISKKTGALIYSDQKQLIDIISNLNSYEQSKLFNISKKQFLNTKYFYSYNKFQEKLRNTILIKF